MGETDRCETQGTIDGLTGRRNKGALPRVSHESSVRGGWASPELAVGKGVVYAFGLTTLSLFSIVDTFPSVKATRIQESAG